MNWTLKKVEQLKAAGKIRDFKINDRHKKEEKEKKASKYGNKKVTVDGIEFASKKEANRYFDLKMLKLGGHIKDLRLQVHYQLNNGGTHSLEYIADFVYIMVKTGHTIVEDAKGYRTREYKKKRRLMKKVYGIIIKET